MRSRQSASIQLEYALLGFLLEQPLHGYEIHHRLQDAQALGLVWHVKQAHLYALLERLEAAGLLVGELVPQDSRPPRRLLRLTDAGREAFQTWLHTPVAHGRDLRIPFLAKLFWAQRNGPASAATIIARQRDACETWLHDLQTELDAVQHTTPFAALVVQFRIGQTQAMLHWLDTCAATLAPDLVQH